MSEPSRQYKAKKAEIDTQLIRLVGRLVEHRQMQALHPLEWQPVEQLDRVLDRLKQAEDEL